MTNKPLIIYHDKCTDGFGAAFAAWMKFGDNAEYVPASYGQDVATGMLAGTGASLFIGTVGFSLTDREVYIVDFSFDRPTMDFIFAQAGKAIWLDHHKTAFEMWPGAAEFKDTWFDAYPRDDGTYLLLDNNKSGALLAWEYFHPGTAVPTLISRIDDRDRWVFQYDDSKALHAGLAQAGFDFRLWEMYVPMGSPAWAVNYGEVVSCGRSVLSAQDANVSRMAAQAMPCRIEFNETMRPSDDQEEPIRFYEYRSGLAVNASIHQSELGHVVATKSGTYALIWYLATDGRANCSLRSNGDYDVSAIAKAFGGGGHRNAAGFQIDVQTLMGWLK